MESKQKAVIGLGMFDGMHLGHRSLVSACVEHAARQNCASAVYTFQNHPFSVFGGEIRLLSDPGEREEAMYGLGIGEVVTEVFTSAICSLSPEAFILRLMERWEIAETVVGFNYTFGARGAGTPETLRQLGERYGFSVCVVPPVLYKDEPVSSTRIRNLLEAGNTTDSEAMLTHPYRITGRIIPNRHIGHILGFPTANLEIPKFRVIPQGGVYASIATIGGKDYPAVTNVGTDPTVGGKDLSVETHLIGFNEDAYGAQLTVSFLTRMRQERQFPSLEELREQIGRDIREAETVTARRTGGIRD